MLQLQQVKDSALYKSESDLWKRRLEIIADTGQDSFTYLELSRLWGISKNGVFQITGEWIRKFPDSIRRIRGQRQRDPVLVVFSLVAEQKPAYVKPEAADVGNGQPSCVMMESIELVDNLSGAVRDVTNAFVDMKETIEEAASAIKEYPTFISEKVYDQTIKRLETIGLEYESIEFERILWDSKKQSGRLQITLRSPEGIVAAVGIYQNGWLINRLAFQV